MAQCAVSPGPKGRADCGANGLRRTAQGGVMTAMGFFHSARGPARLDRPASRTWANASMIPTPWRSSSSASGVAAGFGVLFANLAAGGSRPFPGARDMGQGHGLDATATATRGQAWKRQPGFKGAQRHPQAQKTAPGMTKGGDASAGPRGSGGLQRWAGELPAEGRPATGLIGNLGPRRTARCATTPQRPVS